MATWVSLKQILISFTRLNWPIQKTPFGARVLVISHIQLLFSESEDDWHAEWRVVANAKVSAIEVRVLRPLAKKCTANQRKEHKDEKYIQWVSMLSLTIPLYLKIRLAVVASEICEIPSRNSP